MNQSGVPDEPSDASAALATAAELGPFFRVREVDIDAMSEESTLAELYTGGAALSARVTATARALATTEDRVAASIFFQSVAARLWSPTLAIAVRERGVLWLPPADTTLDDPGLQCSRPALSAVATDTDPAGYREMSRVETEPTGPTGTAGQPTPLSGALAVGLHRVVVEQHLEPLAAVLDVSPTVLWGNAASALVGTYRVMTAGGAGLHDPELLASLLHTGRLADTGTLDPGGRFDRASCCLYYRIPGGGLCGDCVLHRRSDARNPTTG